MTVTRFTRVTGIVLAAVLVCAATGLARPAAGSATELAADSAASLVPADGVLFGVAIPPTGSALGTEAEIAGQERQLDRKMDLHRVYRLWDDELPDTVLSTDVHRGRTPVLSIKPKTGAGHLISWASIARGDRDADITRQAEGIRQLRVPMFLAFHHEPDLSGNRGYGTPTQYVAAWRHYRQVFRAAGVTNVAFTWIVTTATFGTAGAIDSYYPGDDAVDWIGLDAFNWFGCSSGQISGWRSLAEVTAPFAAWAAPHRKPLMLAEWGSVEDPARPGRKAGWVRDALALARSWPQLKAMSYLDAHGSCPWWIDSSRSTLDAFGAVGADPYTHPRPSALLQGGGTLGAAPLAVRFDGSASAGTGAGPAPGWSGGHWTTTTARRR
jgi:hypothetical protein